METSAGRGCAAADYAMRAFLRGKVTDESEPNATGDGELGEQASKGAVQDAWSRGDGRGLNVQQKVQLHFYLHILRKLQASPAMSFQLSS